jgi:hypothetical protein
MFTVRLELLRHNKIAAERHNQLATTQHNMLVCVQRNKLVMARSMGAFNAQTE